MNKQAIKVEKDALLGGWVIVSVKDGIKTEAHPETFFVKSEAEEVAKEVRKELNL